MRSIIFASCLGLACSSVNGRAAEATRLAPLLSSHAVLQRGQPIPISGWSPAGTRITVAFSGMEIPTVADDSGHWLVQFPSQAADATPRQLIVKAEKTIIVDDILLGDVWLASGQSNMYFMAKDAQGFAGEKSRAATRIIRQLQVPLTVSETPQARFDAEWKVCTSDTFGDFSAVAYYFAAELQETIQVPIGIINASFGGTSIEAWISQRALWGNPQFTKVWRRWSDALTDYDSAKPRFDEMIHKEEAAASLARSKGLTAKAPRYWKEPLHRGHRETPAGLYNAMIHPLMPVKLRGIIWYQGENNVSRADEYEALFTALIKDWRSEFDASKLPFYWVQLSAFHSGEDGEDPFDWPRLRDVQTQTLSILGTGQAVSFDVGEAHNIHPIDKQSVGHRLALLAVRRTYGLQVADEGPTFAGLRLDDGKLIVSFLHAEGLHGKAGKILGFEIAGADGKFVTAVATIAGSTVALQADGLATPREVRYAWHDHSVATLENSAGLPAVPFRTDSW